MYVWAPLACLVPMEARKGHWIGLELELQTVGDHMWVLGIQLGSSTLNC